MQENKPNFILRKKRDFGELIAGTFVFLRLNATPIAKAVLLIAGPFMLVSAYFAAYAGSRTSIFFTPNVFTFYRGTYLLYMGFIWLSMLIIICIIHAFVKLRLKEPGHKIEVVEIFRIVRSDFFKALSIFFSTVIIFPVIMIPIIIIYAIALSGSSGGPDFVWLGIAIFAFSIFFLYCLIRFSLVYTFGLLENKAFFYGLARSWKYTRGYWWQTFGVIFVLALLFMPLSFGLQGVASALQFFAGGNPKVILASVFILQFLNSIVGQLLWIVIFTGLILQYFNISERKEQTGMMDKLSEIGKPGTASPEGEEYAG